MFKHIAGTFFTKIVSAAISFALLVLTAKLLGAEIRGIITFIILGVSINVLVSQIAGGPALVYLVPRRSIFSLTVISYVWAVFSCTLFSLILTLTGFIPSNLFYPVWIVSILQSLGYIHLVILLGKQHIKSHNLITLIQSVFQISTFLFVFYLLNLKNIESFIWSLYLANGFVYSIGVVVTFRTIINSSLTGIQSDLKFIFRNGMYTQLASLAHLLSIRVSYYYLNNYEDTSSVGIFSTGVSVTEAILLFGTSVSMVVYAHVANSTNLKKSQETVIKLAKMSFLVAVPCLILLALLPSELYGYIFGAEFTALGNVIISLAPGIALLSFYMIYSHYYSGIGKYYINTIASSISLTITLAGSFIFIPLYGITGAGWVCSAAYLGATVFYFLVFMNHSKTGIAKLLPSPVEDYKHYFNMIINRR